MKTIRFALLMLPVLAFSEASWAAYVVRVDALGKAPVPPNPVKVLGTVTSASPLTLSDGSGTVTVNGLTAAVGDFLVVTGNWDGTSLTVSGTTEGFIGPTKTQVVYIPAGSFLMGNSGAGDDAVYSYYDELPQHSVNLSGYYIGKYDVTRGDYTQFMNASGYSNPAYWSTDGWNWKVSNNATQPQYWDAVQDWASLYGLSPQPFTQTDSYPVVGVTYYEAEAFCNWAGGHLPTEAQWEKAARWNAATSHPNIYPWGDTWDWEKCNNRYDSLYPGWQTSPVGSYPAGASPYGCQEMAGNVWQWCKDWFQDNYYSQSPTGGWVDPQGPASGPSNYRVLRGSSWEYWEARGFRCATRGGLGAGNQGWFDLGFRLAR